MSRHSTRPEDVGFNVRHFGAKGDNATDDTAAFQAAMGETHR